MQQSTFQSHFAWDIHLVAQPVGIEVFRRFFEQIVKQCQDEGLVWGRKLYIDATKVQANASRDSVKPRFAVEAHLTELFATEENVEQEGAQDRSVRGRTYQRVADFQ